MAGKPLDVYGAATSHAAAVATTLAPNQPPPIRATPTTPDSFDPARVKLVRDRWSGQDILLLDFARTVEENETPKESLAASKLCVDCGVRERTRTRRVCTTCKGKREGPKDKSKRPAWGTMSKTLCVDHDHDTGKVRGLLCKPCNMAIGLFRESDERLIAAMRYLQNTRAE